MVDQSIPKRAPSIFVALRYRDFRLLWLGLMVSNLGTWMQFTAIGYFIAQVAGSPHRAALDLGLVGAARAIPVLLLSPLAGVAADELPRRRLVMAANLLMVLAALLLALLSTAQRLEIVGLVLISALNSVGNAFDAPARQSWVPYLVDRQYVGNAVGINSVAFNAPAVVGPALAGVLIAWVGVAASFYVNAVLTLAVVAAVAFMKSSPPPVKRRDSVFAAMREGIAFIAGHPILRWIVLAFFVTAVFARPYSQLVPAFIVNVLGGGARELGWAVSAIGIGGFAGALATAYFAQRERRARLWLQSGLLISVGVMAMALVPSIGLTLPVLFAIGLGTMTLLGATNTLIQTLSPDDVRGRALSVYTMIAIGVVPGGSLVDGAIASVTGLHVMFAIAGAICVVLFLGIWFLRPVVRTV